MTISSSVERKAARISDGVEKLRFLRIHAAPPRKRRVVPMLLAALPLFWPAAIVNPNAIAIPRTPTTPAPVAQSIWVVEQGVYSNGLAVREEYATRSAPRSYVPYSRDNLAPLPPDSRPAGIVFHSTESLILPLEPEHNRSLVRTREALLEHVRRGKLYNYVIDRFGQVYRVIPDGEIAFHAGHSVWAGERAVWIDLNASFLGVAFEAETGGAFQASPAQIHAGRLLTEMLRSRYGIPDANCITHAQVSLNPANMRIGYHTDWAARFPFKETGLETGYDAPVAAIAVFGFRWDNHFLALIGGKPWPGVVRAEEELTRAAVTRGIAPEVYRTTLQRQYHQLRRQHQ